VITPHRVVSLRAVDDCFLFEPWQYHGCLLSAKWGMGG
jgi:hypothetical protein